MARLRHRVTGSEVEVPDEKVDRLYAMGYDVVDDQSNASPRKTAAKKAAASKSED